MKLIAIAGSIRAGSFNQSLLKIVIDAARTAGAEVTVVSKSELDLPLFNQDLEAANGLPENAKRLKQKMVECDGFLISSPEYNSSVTPLLKNAIDWCSRTESEGEPALAAYTGKSALLLSASPGGLGGLRGLFHLRDILQNIGVTVFPRLHSVSSAHSKFDEAGKLTDEKEASKVSGIVADYVKFAAKMV